MLLEVNVKQVWLNNFSGLTTKGEYHRPIINLIGFPDSVSISVCGGVLVISPAVGILFAKSSSKREARAGVYRNFQSYVEQ
jgi:hypothetical protein